VRHEIAVAAASSVLAEVANPSICCVSLLLVVQTHGMPHFVQQRCLAKTTWREIDVVPSWPPADSPREALPSSGPEIKAHT